MMTFKQTPGKHSGLNSPRAGVTAAGTNQQQVLLGGEQGLGLVHHLLEELLNQVGQGLDLALEVVGQRLDLSVEVVGHGLDLLLDVGDEGLDLLLQLGGLGLDLLHQRQDLGPAVLHVSPAGERGSPVNHCCSL